MKTSLSRFVSVLVIAAIQCQSLGWAAEGALEVVPDKIYHVALTPSEASALVLDDFQQGLLHEKKIQQRISTWDKYTGAVLFLTATAAGVYLISQHGYKYVPNSFDLSRLHLDPGARESAAAHSSVSNQSAEFIELWRQSNTEKTIHRILFNMTKRQLVKDIIEKSDSPKYRGGWRTMFSSYQYKDGKHVHYSIPVSWRDDAYSMDFYAKNPLVKTGFFVAATAGAAAFSSTVLSRVYALAPIQWLKSKFLKSAVTTLSRLDQEKITSIFEIAKVHADATCEKAGSGKVAHFGKSIIQSMHITPEAIISGKLILNGIPTNENSLDLIDAARRGEKIYVFSSAIDCQ